MSRYVKELSDEIKSSLDQRKGYHIVARNSDTNAPVVCGVLEPTGSWSTYYSVALMDLRCMECGKVLDASFYENVYFGEFCNYGEGR